MSRREEILTVINKVPALPTIAVEIQNMLRNEDVDFRMLAEKIKYDPGLTANILNLANSAYFGFMRPVNSIADAIVLMGTKRVYELIVAESIAPIILRSVKGYVLSPGQLWQHSVAVAVASEQLVKKVGIRAPEYVFTAGLLHNVGKIVLGTFVEIEAEPILKLAAKDDISFDEAEQAVLGIDHAEVGSILLKKWHLPEHFVEVARYHHIPDKKPKDNILVDLVHAADALVMMAGIGIGADELHYRVDQSVMDRLGINKTVAEIVIADTMESLENLTQLFKKQ